MSDWSAVITVEEDRIACSRTATTGAALFRPLGRAGLVLDIAEIVGAAIGYRR